MTEKEAAPAEPETTTPVPVPEPISAKALVPADDKPAKPKSRIRIIGMASIVCGMVFGAIVEMFVQGAMESTGWFGPTLDTVMSEQMTNFEAIQQKLNELGASTNDADRTRIQKELDGLLQEQKGLTEQTHAELKNYQQQVETLKTQTLEKTGSVGGADVWMSPGQSITVGERGNVVALVSVDGYRRARTNVAGTVKVLNPGDVIEIPAGDAVWKVIYKQTQRGDDKSMVGFDVVGP